MRVLAFDVGLKNLAFCMINDMKIVAWDVVSVIDEDAKLKRMSIEDITADLLIKLNEVFDDDLEVDCVLIENQPLLKNGQMKTVSVCMYTYFQLLRLKFGRIGAVRFVSAGTKLKVFKSANYSPRRTGSYAARKTMAVDLAREYLLEIGSPEQREWFEGLSKKDDASDSLLFAIAHCERTPSPPRRV